MMYLMNAALIPPLLLAVYIYRLDSVEREPAGLLARLFILGAISTIPAMILEEIGGAILEMFIPSSMTTLYLLIENYIVVAWSEEGGKHFMLKRGSWNHPAFDYVFDGVVYGVMTSLGFAAAENILYLMNFGIGIAPVRAFTAIPLHGIAGIFMGHYYGMAKAAEQRGYADDARRNHLLSMLVPILIHGTYDFAASSDNEIISILFFVGIIILDIVAFRKVRAYARADEAI